MSRELGRVRIGIIGAGGIVKSRHIPGFRTIPGVELVGVCNQHRDTAVKVAHEFGIEKIYSSWEHLIEDDEIDAVLIGTWPYLHCPITLAALDAGKHVLTQARMAMNAREAQRMLDRSLECPTLTAMVVPSPYGLVGDRFMRELITDGYLGSVRELHVKGFSNSLADPAMPLGWRQMTKYSGFNMLNLGILHETVLRWCSPPIQVMATASKKIPIRRDPLTRKKLRVGTPDSVQVLTTHEDESVGVYSISGVVWHDVGSSITLYGAHGTLRYDLDNDVILGAASHEKELHPIPIPAKLRGGWCVEEDFIASIRGVRSVTHTDFQTGSRYMQFTEAVARSSRHQAPVTLPLKEFSNPSL
jgi:predicted dehydrogenase